MLIPVCKYVCVFMCYSFCLYLFLNYYYFAGFWLICVRFLMVWPFQLVANFFFKKIMLVWSRFLFFLFLEDIILIDSFCVPFFFIPTNFLFVRAVFEIILMCREVEAFFINLFGLCLWLVSNELYMLCDAQSI